MVICVFLVKVGILGVIIVFMVVINVFQILQLVFLGAGSTIVVVICIFLLIVGIFGNPRAFHGGCSCFSSNSWCFG